jgi:nucleoside-diphosphate-sugar epimerase
MNKLSKESNRQKVALVTGATGFVGSHLVKRLVQYGWQTHIICRIDSNIPAFAEFTDVIKHFYDGSTNNMIQCVADAKPDVVFHLASLFLSQHEAKDIDALIQSNVLFGNRLLEAMRLNSIHNLINTGTSWQHYSNEDYNPVCLYAATKQAFEALLEYYVQAFDFKTITLKLFDTYGPNDPRPKLFHLLNKAASSGQTLDMSRGEQLIDLVHIDDVIEAFMIATQRLLDNKIETQESYAVSSGKPLPLKELVQLYSKSIEQPIKINWGARPYRFREVMKTWDKGSIIKNWSPRITLEAGLKELTD